MIVGQRRVAIVGMGGVFPGGNYLDQFRQKLFAGESFIREWDIAKAWGKSVRSQVSGYITDAEMDIEAVNSTLLVDYPESYIDRLGRIPDANLATADVGSIWAMLGTQQAIAMAGWTKTETESEQTGVVMGSGSAGNTVLRSAWHNFFELKVKSRVTGSHAVDRTMVYREAANVACLIKNKGVCEAIGSACATGLGNIGYAYRLIKFGLQDRIVTGGVEPTSFESFTGFDAMQVLSKGFGPAESSRPFDIDRNGFVCSFGCGVVSLEEYDMAKARGANILAVIDDYFNNSDGDGNMFYPSFDGQRRLWKGLFADKQPKADVVKVHGTSTPVGDTVELFSVIDVMGEEDYHISAPKSQYGHTLGAAGAIELISAVMMLQEQKVLPCLNSNKLNTDLESLQTQEGWEGPLKPVAAYRHLLPQQVISKEINSIVCLNYGFGGTNSAMSISRDSL
jgi:3-oxoacyl-[acyl-carrier-protein] synthase-1